MSMKKKYISKGYIIDLIGLKESSIIKEKTKENNGSYSHGG